MNNRQLYPAKDGVSVHLNIFQAPSTKLLFQCSVHFLCSSNARSSADVDPVCHWVRWQECRTNRLEVGVHCRCVCIRHVARSVAIETVALAWHPRKALEHRVDKKGTTSAVGATTGRGQGRLKFQERLGNFASHLRRAAASRIRDGVRVEVRACVRAESIDALVQLLGVLVVTAPSDVRHDVSSLGVWPPRNVGRIVDDKV